MKNNLQRKLLHEKLKAFSALQNLKIPVGGWVKALRTTLGITLEQLGKKLGVTKQNIQSLEKREKEGNITINSLKETAQAMEMQFVCALLPKDGSLEQLIERKAAILAQERLIEAIEERKNENIESNSRMLWY